MPASVSAPSKTFRGLGDHTAVRATVTFGSDYPGAAGQALSAAQISSLGLTDIDAIVALGTTTQATGQLVEYLPATNALKLRVAATGVATASSDQSAAIVECLFLGSGLSDA